MNGEESQEHHKDENAISVLDRLSHGEVLVVLDQRRVYVSMDAGGIIVTRGILARIEDYGKAVGMPLNYEEKHFESLTAALMSLIDYEWQGSKP